MKRLKYLICFLMIFMLFLVKTPETPSMRQESLYHFTFVCPLTWNLLASGIRDADQNFGTDTKLVGCSRLDPALQASALKTAIYSTPDGIITAGIEDSDLLRDVLREAEEFGIPVVLVDSDLPDSGRICYIGTDNVQAGRLAGRDIYEATGGSAKIGVIASTLSSVNQSERLEGFREEILQYPGLSIEAVAECESSRLLLNEKIPQMLEDHPQISALFCMEGYSSDMTGNILKQLGEPYCDIPVVSFDLVAPSLQYIEEGTYYSIIAQSPYEQGYLAVSALVSYLSGEPVEDTIFTDTISIKKQNLKDEVSVTNENHSWHLY